MKLTQLAAATAALAIAGIGTAQADSFASALFDQKAFKWINVATGLPLVNGVDGTIQASGQNSAQASVSLNGTGPAAISDSPLVATTGGLIPFRSICTGPDCIGNPPNPYPTNTTPNGLTYAYGDYSLSGAVVDIPAFGITAGAVAHSTSQVDLSGKIPNPSTGTSTSAIGANVSFLITPSTDLTTYFTMEYAVHLLANVVSPYGLTDNARAGMSFTLSVEDINGLEDPFIWTPTNLNRVVGTGAGEGLRTFDAVTVGYGGAIPTLTSPTFFMDADDTYRFTINAQRFADASRDVVPEPGSLALFGLGLAGLAFARSRKKA